MSLDVRLLLSQGVVVSVIRILFAIGVLSMFGVGGVASSSSAEAWGQAGGCCLASWAPCVALHQAYGEYLFQGTPPNVPKGLTSVMRRTQDAAEQLMLLLVEEPNPPAEPIVASTELRRRLTEEDHLYREVFLHLDDLSESDPEMLLPIMNEAADDGFFVMILEIKELLDALVESLLAEIDEADGQVRFSAAFIAEGLLAAPDAARLDPQWIEALAFLGEAPAGVLPGEAVAAVGRLIQLAEAPRELTPGDWSIVRNEAVRLKESLNDSPEQPAAAEPSSGQTLDEAGDFVDAPAHGSTPSTEWMAVTVVIGLTLAVVLGLGVLVGHAHR